MTVIVSIIASLSLILVLVLTVKVYLLRRRLDGVPADGDVVGLLSSLARDLAEVGLEVADLRPRLEKMETAIPRALSRTGVVTYDAFGDISGNVSRSIALLDMYGDGLVISLLVGRNETLFYTKQIHRTRGAEELSPEEAEAVARAMRR